MKKIKVGALAKEFGKTTKEVLLILKDMGIDAKTAASSIDEEAVKVIRELLTPSGKKEALPIKEEIKEKIVEHKEDQVKKEVLKEEVVTIEKAEEPSVDEEKNQEREVTSQFKTSIKIPFDGIILKDFAEKLKLKSSDIIKELMIKGVLVTLNQKISSDIAVELGAKFSCNVEVEIPISEAKKGIESEILEEDLNKLQNRPPVVTIMGHVDHGKTKLLDAIRSTKVAESEAGGITQHIGAYQVVVNNRKITFLDTPGHEAFTALRARGAKVTDIAVLVVAADDGVMPQTIEAIDHARAAGVPIIVAINKIDKPGVNEDWGGSTVTVPISAKEKTGIDDLLEMIILVADMQELKANPEGKAIGIVVEAKLEKGRGPVASVLIKKGKIKIGDFFVIGSTYGKVRALISDTGKRITSAGPSTPVEVLGSSVVPSPGDILHVTDSDKEAKMMAEKNKLSKGVIAARHHHTLEDFSKEVEEGEVRDLNLIVKADVQGSLEALLASLKDIYVSDRRVRIVHAAVGNILESDVLLAEASNAFVIGFSVTISPRAREISEEEGVDIKIYDVIYKLLDDVKKAMEGMLKPEYEEVKTGSAEVRQTFRFSKVGAIAGCFVKSGKMVRGHGLRIFRNGEKIYEGKLESLKRFKEDIKEVSEGYECGIAIVGYQDFEPGDIIETFEIREKSKK